MELFCENGKNIIILNFVSKIVYITSHICLLMKYNYSRHYSTPNSQQQSADYLNKTTMKQTNSCPIVAGWQPLDRKHVISLQFYTIALFPFV